MSARRIAFWTAMAGWALFVVFGWQRILTWCADIALHMTGDDRIFLGFYSDLLGMAWVLILISPLFVILISPLFVILTLFDLGTGAEHRRAKQLERDWS